jgi:predicted alpha/beta hydrolase family esterase
MNYEILLIQAATEAAIAQEQKIVDALRAALGENFTIHHPLMPDADEPDYDKWKTAIKKELQNLPGKAILLGHSLGGSIILKLFSQENVPGNVIGMVLFGIPFWGKGYWEVEEFEIEKDAAAKLATLENIYIYQSHDDEVVSFDHLEAYRKLLPKANWKTFSGVDHSYHGAILDIIKDVKQLTGIDT